MWLMAERIPAHLVRTSMVRLRVMMTPVQAGSMIIVTVWSHCSVLWSQCSMMYTTCRAKGSQS